MKKTYKYIALAALALSFTACSQDDDFAPQQEDIVKIASANIATEVQTRVNTLNDGTAWENGDQILLVNNSRNDKNCGTYTYNGSAWSLTDGIVIYASGTDATNSFTAYYPAKSEADYVLPTDQSTEAGIKSADRMVATTSDDVAKGAAVALNFKRQNAKVTIVPTITDEYDRSATISELTIGSITPYHPTGATDYTAIIAPTLGFEATVKVKVGDSEQTLTAPCLFEIEAGKQYSIALQVGKDVVNVNSVSVESWTDNTLTGGETTEDYKYDEANNTYTVYTAEGLYAWSEAARAVISTSIGDTDGDWYAEYTTAMPNLTLAADITLTGENNWTPLGELVETDDTGYFSGYTGVIDGKGHTITGLNINSTEDWIAFLCCLGPDGEVKNLTFEDANIIGGEAVATLAAVCVGNVTNCHVTGNSSVSGTNTVAGVVAQNRKGVISGCTNAATVTAEMYYAGGIAGSNEAALIGCFNSGNIIGSYNCGGVVGYNTYADDDTSYVITIACGNTGNVSGTSVVGGIIGFQSGWVYACWTKDTSERTSDGTKVTDKEGVGYHYSDEIQKCYSFTDATAVTSDIITAMNTAIDEYNTLATEGWECTYKWEFGTDGYPALVKTE